MGYPPFTEGIQMGDEMAEIAVGAYEEDDARLGTSNIRRQDRLSIQPQFESFEKEAPAFIDGCRVPAPALVRSFDGIQVPARRRTRAYHDKEILLSLRDGGDFSRS